ncbi:hypothetical protein H6P81_010452 [Aristolochia fimbriata]|uniref:Carbamoyl-phosphate synthase small subunit N-terminal domain-containing protein n=1 Tax=Aristolochia fimbriata TaxID=158543 RepID=A0AAV7ENU1_ARIFI|nr:hypothetical protein H6P81_010452 [Aristolochia fimbriata]
MHIVPRGVRGDLLQEMIMTALNFACNSPLFCSSVAGSSQKSGVLKITCSALVSPDIAASARPWKVSDARLILEDGSIWRAKSFGASGTQIGELVFNTSMTGRCKINTGVNFGNGICHLNYYVNFLTNKCDEESSQCFLAGLVIRSLSICTSNWRCTESLEDYLAKRNIMGIYDVDTRAITRRLRQDGSLIGVLSTEESKTDEELLEMSRIWDIVGRKRIKLHYCMNDAKVYLASMDSNS